VSWLQGEPGARTVARAPRDQAPYFLIAASSVGSTARM